MKVCMMCGAQNADENIQCAACGAELPQIQWSVNNQPVGGYDQMGGYNQPVDGYDQMGSYNQSVDGYNQMPYGNSTTPKKKVKGWLVAVIIATVLLVAGGAVTVFLLTRHGEKTAKDLAQRLVQRVSDQELDKLDKLYPKFSVPARSSSRDMIDVFAEADRLSFLSVESQDTYKGEFLNDIQIEVSKGAGERIELQDACDLVFHYDSGNPDALYLITCIKYKNRWYIYEYASVGGVYSAEQVAQDFIEAMSEKNVDKMANLCPPFLDPGKDDIEDMIDMYEGYDVTFKYEGIESRDDYTDSELDDLAEDASDYAGEDVKLQDACDVEFSFNMKMSYLGQDMDKSQTYTLTCIKYKGKWYLYE